MWDFLLGMAAGSALRKQPEDAVSKERLYEHAQTKVLIEIVHAADRIEKNNPLPEVLKLQLQPLKSMFDAIDRNGIKSSEGKIVYRQVKDYFTENGL